MTFEEYYRGCWLDGIPYLRRSDRSWVPRLIVSDHRRGQHTHHTISLAGLVADCATAGEAAAAALLVGRKWVDDHA